MDVRTLQEYRLGIGGKRWTILHSRAVVSLDDELVYLKGESRVPYGAVLWPAAIALAHEVAARGDALRGLRVLELGAGTGLPGIVAATFGARVAQTDQAETLLDVCRRNGERNRVPTDCRLADWTAWTDPDRYDVVLGSDILYAESLHADLRCIFERNLAAGGRLLLSDPFRETSLRLLEGLEADGWTVGMNKWTIGERAIGVFEVTRDLPLTR